MAQEAKQTKIGYAWNWYEIANNNLQLHNCEVGTIG